MTSPDKLISSILKHDTKQNNYKIALLRAIDDVVLAALWGKFSEVWLGRC